MLTLVWSWTSRRKFEDDFFSNLSTENCIEIYNLKIQKNSQKYSILLAERTWKDERSELVQHESTWSYRRAKERHSNPTNALGSRPEKVLQAKWDENGSKIFRGKKNFLFFQPNNSHSILLFARLAKFLIHRWTITAPKMYERPRKVLSMSCWKMLSSKSSTRENIKKLQIRKSKPDTTKPWRKWDCWKKRNKSNFYTKPVTYFLNPWGEQVQRVYKIIIFVDLFTS